MSTPDIARPGQPAGTAPSARPLVALRLTVNNHPGVMSHVCGLFARRAFNVEAILCTPVNGGQVSRIWLLVAEDERLEQMVRQVRKLHDVLASCTTCWTCAAAPPGARRSPGWPTAWPPGNARPPGSRAVPFGK